jgi:tetratricopeptide (TPR) repeat protein
VAPVSRLALLICTLSISFSVTIPAHAGKYVVDGFALGDRVNLGANYHSYTCRRSDDFDDALRCEQTRQRSSRASKVTISGTLIHDSDGTALYVMTNAAPVTLDKNVVQAEISNLSREFNERPAKVDWLPEGRGPTAVIAIWGQLKLDELNGDDIETLADGKSPHLGVLVDFIGDLEASAKNGLPVFRISGGSGYIYSAHFAANGKGHRHYVAVNGLQLAVRKYRASLKSVLERDRVLANDDYRLWPEVALLTRNLSRDTTPKFANEALDKVFNEAHSAKLRSHVWSVLPLGAIGRLSNDIYSRLDHYGPQTKYPDVRRDVERFLANEPGDRFVEFGYFIIGDFERALSANQRSVISNVLQYGSGYQSIQSMMQDALALEKTQTSRTTSPGVKQELDTLIEEPPDTEDHVNNALRVSNQTPDLYGRRPVGTIIPNFAARAASAHEHFEAVLRHPNSPMADDAAYMLGWLERARGNLKEALPYLSEAMVAGNADYKPAALKEVVRILEHFPAPDQLAIVESSSVFAQQPALWYTAARSAYREFDYTRAIDAGQRALKAIKVPIEQVPMTTDPARIEPALEKINSELIDDPNVSELPYIIQASREISLYLASLSSAEAVAPDVFARNARSTIIKYSTLVEQREPDQSSLAQEPVHRDLRQAIHLIDMTMRSTPSTPQYARLREWMHYRKVRILAAFAPEKVPEEIAAMRREFPASKLLANALAEQVFAQGITMKDPDAADKTFRELLEQYPNSNVIDNAYSWMAISLRCAGRLQAAENINRQIVNRFPLTRHARYARSRLANPNRGIDERSCGWPRG